MRLGAGVWAAITGQGEVGKYPGVRGKLGAALALLKGDWQALPLLPRMLAKRREVERIRKLSPRRSEAAHYGTSDFSQGAHAPGGLGMRIYIIATGGTIEKVYSEQTGNVQNLDSKIDRYFRMLRLPDAEIAVTHLMNKDSLEMTDADRENVLATVREKLEAEPAPVVITHGTDTMVETGLLLQRNLPDLRYPIVLTGAMTPLGFRGQRWIAKPDRKPARGARAAPRRLRGDAQSGLPGGSRAQGSRISALCVEIGGEWTSRFTRVAAEPANPRRARRPN